MVTLPIRPVTDAVDLADLRDPAAALVAPAQMRTHAVGVPGGESSAQVPAEPVAGPSALRVLGHRDVLLEVEAAQALAGAVGQHGDRVRGHAELPGDLGRRVALD